MTFSSLLFIYAFLPLSLGLYYFTPKKFRNAALFLISVVFCGMCSLWFLGFMFLYVLINYAAGISVRALSKHKPLSAAVLALGVLADLSVFLLFRTDFIPADGIKKLILPVGLSFLTLTSIGYLADVFCGRIKAERNLFRFALYMMYFPKLPMGPVTGYGSFSGKLKQRTDGLSAVGEGAEIFVCGLAKKVILADNLYMLYNAVRTMEVGGISALSAWLGVVSYLLGIYFTLSGLSDMGAGISLCFGIRLPASFDYPLFSRGMTDFGRSWHIPVVRRLRRYIENPVVKRSSGHYMRYIMTAAVWILAGLWYEISPNKLIWGFIIGAAVALEMKFSDHKSMKSASVVYTLMILVVSFIFFFGDSLSYSFKYFLAMIGGNNNIADSVSLYLLRAYSVLIIIGAVFASGLLRKYLWGASAKIVRKTVRIISPVIMLGLLILCTAVISYTGISETLLIKL